MSLRPFLVLPVVLSALAAGAAGPDQAVDLMNTPECRAARTRLDVVTAAADGRHPSGIRALQSARERAARACFGRPADSAAVAPPGDDLRAPQPTVRMPPVMGVAAQPPALPTPVAPSPPVAIPRPAVITQCDPTGCWDSSGRRLNRVSPGLAGPGGPCTVAGNSAMCP